MKRIQKYQTALVAAIAAGFVFLPQVYAADSAYKTDAITVDAENVDKYLVTTNTITEQEIAERGYRNLADILSQVPGLYMAPADKNSKMVRIRGAEVGQTKVYIDGIPAFPLNGIASNAAADLSTIPADSIAKVEIIKGPGPVKYGTDYKGGVILVTTKDGNGAGKFRLSIAGGSHHTYDMHLCYSGSDKNISYTLNASKRHTGGYLPNSANDKLYFDKTRMTIGVRHESLSQDANNIKSTDHAIDPVLNITHDLTKSDTLRFSAGRTHVFVQAKSAATNIRANVPVPKPERDRNFEFGWKHRFSPKSELDLAVFYTDVTDRIVRLVRGGPYYNVDQTKIRGVEFGYQHKFTQNFSSFANYTWMSAEDKANGKTTDATGIPHQIFNLGLTYREGKWHSTLLGRAVSGWTNGSSYPNSTGYFTADLDLRYEPQTDLGVFLRVNNIFNRDYQDKLYHPAEGTNFLLGVDMSF